MFLSPLFFLLKSISSFCTSYLIGHVGRAKKAAPLRAAHGTNSATNHAVDLSTALTGETLQPLLQNQEFLDKVKEFLPAGEEGKEVTLSDLSGTVQSPQFQQAVSMFSMALGSGQLGPVIKEFGLGDEAAAAAAQVRQTIVM